MFIIKTQLRGCKCKCKPDNALARADSARLDLSVKKYIQRNYANGSLKNQHFITQITDF